MSNETLLERIRNLEKTSRENRDNKLLPVVDSVLSYLRKILNTRQGSVPIADDFGMPDFTNFPGENMRDTTVGLEQAMKNVIEKYEPRLRNVAVEFTPDLETSSILKFRLSAEIFQESTKTPVMFETVVTPDGEVVVNR